MKKVLLIAVLVAFASPAAGDHLDVIAAKLKENCTLAQYLAIVKDFNEQWGMKNGYRAEIAVPLQDQDLSMIYWTGRSANAAAFGNAWDVWRDGLTDSNSLPAKLQARFDKCSDNVSRSGFDAY